ncbi:MULTISPECIES: protein singed [unclassified Pseudomonas]|uniref:protein singed n=1 Tax=unclassified Pseudomonas TaxID=196821 RepID=UPI0018E73053|nr:MULTISPECIES: protein singed [unclassified Pseudomonas]MBJ2224915.1 protein singed [Pseudomonas sp. MF7451]MBJ2303855.1 protein singed [Pseudomonas sp. MF2846]MBK3492280.1 protein singed [Pseudomonas sp. MF2857]
MATYITVADVDAILGSTWAPDDKKARAVLQANAYLTSLNLVGVDMSAIPEEVKQAGAELAVVASQGKLYQQHTEGSLEAKTVKAGSVTTSKTFASIDTTKSSSLPDGVQFALGLLGPWRTSAFSFNVYR